jgi:hypothetical protein
MPKETTVKRFISLFVAFEFVTGLAGLAVAQTGTATEKKPADKMEKPAAEKKAEKKPAAKTAKGTVKSASADSIVVAGKEKGKDAEWTFAVDPKTKVKKGGKDAMAADVKEGDMVQVRYTEDGGKAVAQSVTVSGAKKGAAKSADKPMGDKPAAEKK